jgi:hypothetical protein
MGHLEFVHTFMHMMDFLFDLSVQIQSCLILSLEESNLEMIGLKILEWIGRGCINLFMGKRNSFA